MATFSNFLSCYETVLTKRVEPLTDSLSVGQRVNRWSGSVPLGKPLGNPLGIPLGFPSGEAFQPILLAISFHKDSFVLITSFEENWLA